MSLKKLMYLSLAVFATLVAGNAISHAFDDDSECDLVEAMLVSMLTSPATTAGIIDGDFEGTTAFQILSTSEGPTESTTAYTGTLVITTEEGELTTFSRGVFEPAPEGLGTQFDRVVDGTGIFAGATGELFFNFKTNADGTGFTSTVSGQICVLEDDDD